MVELALMRGGGTTSRVRTCCIAKRHLERQHAGEEAAAAGGEASTGINVVDNGVTRPLDLNALRALIVSASTASALRLTLTRSSPRR